MVRETQLFAYQEILPHLPEKRFEILQTIIKHGGLALFEIAEIRGEPLHWVSGRLTELTNDSWILDSGARRINPDSEKPQIVWRWSGNKEPIKLKKKTKIQLLQEQIVSRDAEISRLNQIIEQLRDIIEQPTS